MEKRTEKSVKDFTIEELKAKAYDQLVLIEKAQINLRRINDEISSRNGSRQEVKEGS